MSHIFCEWFNCRRLYPENNQRMRFQDIGGGSLAFYKKE